MYTCCIYLFCCLYVTCIHTICAYIHTHPCTRKHAGVSVTIEYYISVLEMLHSKYKWNIFVQPVAPVLNETRDLVKVLHPLFSFSCSSYARAHRS
jgi:hypothetical protein